MNYKASSSSSELGTRWATTNLSYLNYHWKLKVWFFLLKFSTTNARRLTSIWQLRSFKLFIRNSNTFRLLCACGQHWTIRICSQLCTTWWWPFINILHANTMYLPCRYLILMVYFDFKGLRNYLKNMHFRSSSRTFDLYPNFLHHPPLLLILVLFKHLSLRNRIIISAIMNIQNDVVLILERKILYEYSMFCAGSFVR